MFKISKTEWYRALIDRQGSVFTEKFASSKVVICGLGGLGSSIAISLARSGIGYLHLIDFDYVELSNIHRQQYRLAQIGQRKTEALSELIQEVAPFCEIKLNHQKLSRKNITEILGDEDIICEAFDNPEAKAMLAENVRSFWPDKKLIMASGMAGFNSANDIKTKKFGDNFYICGDGESDIEHGLPLVASRVNICANHQALLILQLIAGIAR